MSRSPGDARPFGRLPTFDEALSRWLGEVPGPAGPPERVPVPEALGRVLAEPVRAVEDLPPFDRATVDGFAVRAADTAAASPGQPVALRLAGEVRMGEAPAVTCGPGEAVAVATGAALPPGADAVVMAEHARIEGAAVWVARAVHPGEGVLPRGADVRAVGEVVPSGRRLGPAEVAAAAAAGAVELAVWPRPRVAVLCTGDELVGPGEPLPPGRVRDANGYGLVAAAARDGCAARFLGRWPDRLEALVAALAGCGDDAVLVSGGSSVGVRDLVPDAVRALPGARIVVHGVAIRPGKPVLLALARGGRQLICGLPGNPVSALVVYELFVRPALARRAGEDPPPRPVPVRARLAAPVRRPAEREDFVRVALRAGPDGLWAEPVPGGSGVLQSLVRADGLLRVPWSREGFAAGEEVEVWWLRRT